MGFAASPIDTATPQENQRLETRHVGASKRTFSAKLPQLLTLCSYKIDAFLEVVFWTYLKIYSCEASINFHHMSQNSTPAHSSTPTLQSETSETGTLATHSGKWKHHVKSEWYLISMSIPFIPMSIRYLFDGFCDVFVHRMDVGRYRIWSSGTHQVGLGKTNGKPQVINGGSHGDPQGRWMADFHGKIPPRNR